jgi:hypothetical protein
MSIFLFELCGFSLLCTCEWIQTANILEYGKNKPPVGFNNGCSVVFL